MKVVFTIDSLTRGGTELSLLQMLSCFSDTKKITVVYFFPDHTLKDDFTGRQIKTVFIPVEGRYGLLKGVGALGKFLKKECPDLVVSSLYRSNIISRLACLKARVPLVGSFVTDSYGHQRQASFRGLNKVKFYSTWLLDRLTAGIPRAYVSNGMFIARSNSNALGIPKSKVHVVNRGRDISEIRTITGRDNRSTFVFTAIGRLYESKGIADLIKAFRILSEKYEHVKLEIVGDGPQRAGLEQMTVKYQLIGKVIFKGQVPSAWKSLYASNVFVFPSHYEGFSGVLIEAMLTGIPIVASDIPMNLEAVSHGKTARVFLTGDPQSLFEEMEWMVNNYEEAEELGLSASEYAVRTFNLKTVSGEFEKLLETITDQNRRN